MYCNKSIYLNQVSSTFCREEFRTLPNVYNGALLQKYIDDWKSLSNFSQKTSIVDFCVGSKYTSADHCKNPVQS